MGVSYGFYDSKNGDRKYNALQMSSIFDGIIQDGVIQHYGNRFYITPQSGLNVKVDTGRAWFNHTWTLNDNYLVLAIDRPDLVMARIDTVVLEVDRTDDNRRNRIFVKKGTPATIPVPPTLVKANNIYQYPLADIRVNANATSFTQANITNRVGTSDTPYVTAPLEKMDIDELIAQWQRQWTEDIKGMDSEFYEWFDYLRDRISTDPAVSLQLQIKDITTTYKLNVLSSGWSSSAPYTQTINVNGMKSTNVPFVSPDVETMASGTESTMRLKLREFGYITSVVTQNGSIKLTAKYRKPTQSIPIVVKGV